MAKEQKNHVEVLERGNIFFLYRPVVDEEEVKGLEDVQRFFMLLHPANSRMYRMIIIGKKKLPEANRSGERYWGFVDSILRTDKQLKEQFAAESYETQTHGDRLVPSMRPAGMGEYQLVRHDDHTHLVYELMLPTRRSDVQQDLNIARSSTYIISVKNPTASTPRGVGLEGDQKAQLPKHLQERFKGRRFLNSDPPELLNHEGIEILLISTDERIKSLGLDLEAQQHDAEKDAEYIFKTLHMHRNAIKEKSLLSGKWQ